MGSTWPVFTHSRIQTHPGTPNHFKITRLLNIRSANISFSSNPSFIIPQPMLFWLRTVRGHGSPVITPAPYLIYRTNMSPQKHTTSVHSGDYEIDEVIWWHQQHDSHLCRPVWPSSSQMTICRTGLEELAMWMKLGVQVFCSVLVKSEGTHPPTPVHISHMHVRRWSVMQGMCPEHWKHMHIVLNYTLLIRDNMLTITCFMM